MVWTKMFFLSTQESDESDMVVSKINQTYIIIIFKTKKGPKINLRDKNVHCNLINQNITTCTVKN